MKLTLPAHAYNAELGALVFRWLDRWAASEPAGKRIAKTFLFVEYSDEPNERPVPRDVFEAVAALVLADAGDVWIVRAK